MLLLFAALCLSQAFSVLSAAAVTHTKFLFMEKQALIKCQKEGNFPESFVDDVYHKRTTPPDSKCFLHCAFKEVGWLTDGGDPDLKAIHQGVAILYSNPKHHDLVDKFLNECYEASPKDDQCELVRSVAHCVFEKDKAAYTPSSADEKEEFTR